MKQDESGAWLMEEGDIFSQEHDPNLSGSPFQVVQDGDGEYVKLTGFGYGDPTVAKARQGARIRAFPVDLPGAEPDSPEIKAYKRSFVSVVNQGGEKVPLGRWSEV